MVMLLLLLRERVAAFLRGAARDTEGEGQKVVVVVLPERKEELGAERWRKSEWALREVMPTEEGRDERASTAEKRHCRAIIWVVDIVCEIKAMNCAQKMKIKQSCSLNGTQFEQNHRLPLLGWTDRVGILSDCLIKLTMQHCGLLYQQIYLF